MFIKHWRVDSSTATMQIFLNVSMKALLFTELIMINKFEIQDKNAVF